MKQVLRKSRRPVVYVAGSVAAVVAALVVVALFLAVAGRNPFETYAGIASSAFGSWFAWSETLVAAIPLMFCGLGVAIAARVGLMSIGAEGQLYIGAAAAAVVALEVKGLPSWQLLPLMMLAACVAGAAWSGVPGFLRNLDEMLETADAEGATWRAFIGQWWDRFGTTEVGTGDLFAIALETDSPLPLGSGNERAQRTNLGRALTRMRDRVFTVGGRRVRVRDAGTLRRARQWKLGMEENNPGLGSPGSPQESRGSGSPGSHSENAPGLGSPGSPACEPTNLGSHQVHTEINLSNQRLCEPGEPSEPNSIAYTRADARARVKESAGRGSPSSPGSHSFANSTRSGCEPTGEPWVGGSQPRKTPDGWWEEVI